MESENRKNQIVRKKEKAFFKEAIHRSVYVNVDKMNIPKDAEKFREITSKENIFRCMTVGY